MSAESTDLERSEHGVWWWVIAILMPIGVLSGPIAIANMFADLIEWNDWIGTLVHHWDDNISRPIKIVLDYVASRFHLPPVPRWFADYSALGVIFVSTSIRARTLLPTPPDPLAKPDSPRPPFRWWHVAPIAIVWSVRVLLWPLILLSAIVVPLLAVMLVRHGMDDAPYPAVFIGLFILQLAASSFLQVFLATASFALFGILCVINAIWG